MFEIVDNENVRNFISLCLKNNFRVKYNSRDKCLVSHTRYPEYPGIRLSLSFYEKLYLKHQGTLNVVTLTIEDELIKMFPAKNLTWNLIKEICKEHEAES